MPAAIAAPLIGGALGLGGGALSGKGAKAAQKQQLGIENQLLGITKQQANIGQQYSQIGIPALQNSSNYWTSILKGGPQAQQAVGPVAGLMGQQYAGAARSLQGSLPAGGETNLALANLKAQQAQQTGQLYQGLQPTAAQQLTAIGTGAGQTGAGTTGAGGFLGYAGVNAGQGALQSMLQQQMMQMQSGAGLGAGIGSLMANKGAKGSPASGGASSASVGY